MMEDLETELQRAAEELRFWRDFARWHRKSSPRESARIKAAIERAEARYLAARLLLETREPALADDIEEKTGTLH